MVALCSRELHELNMKKSTVDKRLQAAYRKIEKSMIAKGYDDAFV